jgi:hypothetical protein
MKTILTECEPDKLIIGAASALVRCTDRMRPFERSSLEEEMTIWFGDGSDDLARLMRAPAGGGDAPLFDILF